MKSITDHFFVWWLHTGRYNWSRFRRCLSERKYLNIVIPEANSLEEITELMRQITWTKDGLLHLYDCISYPQVTWAKKKDDCDGFSCLAAEIIRRWNPDYKPVLVTAVVRPIKYSHTVCAFMPLPGVLYYFDNASLKNDALHTYDEIITKITRGTQRVVCWDVRDPETFELLEFHRL
jgi:hypothetical protein